MLKALRGIVKPIEDTQKTLDDFPAMFELADEDPSFVGEVRAEVSRLEATLDACDHTGKALTANIQRVFQNTIHLQTVAKRTKVDDAFTGRKVDELDLDYRLYTRDHFNANGAILTRYKGCTRGVSEAFPQFFQAEEPGTGVLEYYKALFERRQTKAQALIG